MDSLGFIVLFEFKQLNFGVVSNVAFGLIFDFCILIHW